MAKETTTIKKGVEQMYTYSEKQYSKNIKHSAAVS